MNKIVCKNRLFSYGMASILILLLTGTVHAWVAAHDGNYYHGYNHGGDYYHGGGYYYGGYNAHGVVIGVPSGAYYGHGCTNVQKCYSTGDCVNERVCN